MLGPKNNLGSETHYSGLDTAIKLCLRLRIYVCVHCGSVKFGSFVYVFEKLLICIDFYEIKTIFDKFLNFFKSNLDRYAY